MIPARSLLGGRAFFFLGSGALPAPPPPSKDTPILPKIDPELQRRITEATHHLAIAERELEAALGEIEQAQRADKKIISSRLAIAFEKLSLARRNLEAMLREGA